MLGTDPGEKQPATELAARPATGEAEEEKALQEFLIVEPGTPAYTFTRQQFMSALQRTLGRTI